MTSDGAPEAQSESQKTEAESVLEAEIDEYESDIANMRRLIANEKLLLAAEARYHPSEVEVEVAGRGGIAKDVNALRKKLEMMSQTLEDELDEGARELDEAASEIASSSAALSKLSAELSMPGTAEDGGPQWVPCSGIAAPIMNALLEGDLIEWDGASRCRRHPGLDLDARQ